MTCGVFTEVALPSTQVLEMDGWRRTVSLGCHPLTEVALRTSLRVGSTRADTCWTLRGVGYGSRMRVGVSCGSRMRAAAECAWVSAAAAERPWHRHTATERNRIFVLVRAFGM